MLWSIISTCSINQWCFSYYNFLKNILYQYNYNFKLQFQRRWYEKYIRQKNFLACIFLDCLPKWSIRRLPLGRIFLGTLQANLTLFWITIKQFWFILVVNMQQLANEQIKKEPEFANQINSSQKVEKTGFLQKSRTQKTSIDEGKKLKVLKTV